MERTCRCEVCDREYDTESERIAHLRTIGLVD